MSIPNTIRNIPHSPGVYTFFDKDKNYLYIGKAKDLRKRVPSYFVKDAPSVRIAKMRSQINSVDYVATNTELEALLLETTLIKEKRPKYNILMRDDKNYSYIKVHIKEDFPRIEIVRKMNKDSCAYFGPKISAGKAGHLIDVLRKIFPIRNCNLGIDLVSGKENGSEIHISYKTISYPCLEYHLKRCCAPCIGAIQSSKYREFVENILHFLRGDTKEVVARLKTEMSAEASSRNYEKAAQIRDALRVIHELAERQIVSEAGFSSRDVFNYVIISDRIAVNVLNIRTGKLVGQNNYTFIGKHLSEMTFDMILFDILTQYYENTPDIPDEIVIPHEIADNDVFQGFLSQRKEKKTKIIVPQKGIKDKLLDLSRKNALLYADKIRSEEKIEIIRSEGACAELKSLLNLSPGIRRIEAYDISHFSGSNTVGSMIVFEKGRPKKADYRRFQLKTIQNTINDFASLGEVLSRRLKYLVHKERVQKLDIRFNIPTKKEFANIQKIISKEKLDDTELKKEQFICARQDKEMIGFVRLKEYDGKIAEIATLFVISRKRHHHIGYLLMQELIRRSSYKRFYSTVREHLTKYYAEFGFQEIHAVPDVLVKKLKPLKIKSYGSVKIIPMAFERKKSDSSFLSKPDLIIIDGGKGQLSSGVNVLIQSDFIDIPIISIAKRNEEIFLPSKKDPVILSKDNPILHLVQRIRDEAHRFAISYHKNLRDGEIIQNSKFKMQNEIQNAK